LSAIFGILRFDQADISQHDLERMGQMLAHRGSDGRNFAIDGPIGFGNCLTRVNNEDRFEAQPVRDRKANLTLVADLRLDNREELASFFGIAMTELRDMPDSELVMRAYKKWGQDCAEHLLGDFAFAIWDGCAKKLVLARDHMGQRYVHYHRTQHFFAFATEIKALWALPDVPRELNEQQLGRFLVADLRPRDGGTLFEEIFGLPGGTTMTVRHGGKLSHQQYWQPAAAAEHLFQDEGYYLETYRRILGEAVNCRIRRLIAPPALCLSAGYDSAGIAGMCGPVLTAQQRKLITVSSVLPKDHSGACRDMRSWVELCRRHMPHLDVRYFVRRPERLDIELGTACGTADDVPSPVSHILDGLFGIAATAGAGLVMDGIGGDWTLNPRGGKALAYFLRKGKVTRFLSELRAYRHASGRSFCGILRTNVGFALSPAWLRRAWLDLRGLGPKQLNRFVAPVFLRELRESGSIDPTSLSGTQSGVGMRQAVARQLRDFANRPRSHYANEAAAYGLELTRPMLDKRAVEFGLAVPEDFYLVKGHRRYLARRALADVYPREYQNRGEHQDPFDPDFAETFREALPQIRGRLKRMRNDAFVRKYLAVDELGRSCAQPRSKPIDAANATYALRAFKAAVYINWLRGE
jgi:asparagine synthase (glutamine-hydrolysing)